MQQSVNKYIKNWLIKARPFHKAEEKHLPVMKVYKHQVQRHSAKFLNGCIGQDDNVSTMQLWSFFCQLMLVSIWPTLNQTRRCSAVRSYLFELINNFFELAKERQRERERDETCACEPASVRLSLQAMKLSYFKNSVFTPSLQRNIMLRVSNLSKLFY